MYNVNLTPIQVGIPMTFVTVSLRKRNSTKWLSKAQFLVLKDLTTQ